MEGVFEKKNTESDNENEDPKDLTDSKAYDEELYEKFKPKPRKSVKNLKLISQKFAFNKTQGFIYSTEFPNLVFGVSDVENNQSEVYLMKK